MTAALKKSIEKFNQDVLVYELRACEQAKRSLEQALAASFPHPNEDQQSFCDHNKAMLGRLLGKMIAAEDYESLQVSHQQFHQYMDALAESLELSQDGVNVLGQYEYFNGFLNDVYGLEYASREQFLQSEGIAPPEGGGIWQEKLQALKEADSEASFEAQKEALLDALLQDPEQAHIQSLLFYGSLTRAVDGLAGVRESYLEKNVSKSRVLKDVGWIGLGAVVVGLATGFALAAPVLAIPALVLAGGVMLYGAVDASKAITEVAEEHSETVLGERDLEELSDAMKDRYDIAFLQEHRAQQSVQAKNDKRWFGALGIGASLGGLGLAVLAFAAVVPALAFPPALGIAIAVLSVGAVLAAGAMLGLKTWRSFQRNKAFKAEADKDFRAEMDTYELLDNERKIDIHQEHDIVEALSQACDRTATSEPVQVDELTTQGAAPEPKPEPSEAKKEQSDTVLESASDVSSKLTNPRVVAVATDEDAQEGEGESESDSDTEGERESERDSESPHF